MAGENEKERAAAICKNCGAAIAVRIGSEGEIQPIGTGTAEGCTCEDTDLRIMNAETDSLKDTKAKKPERTG